MDLRNYVSVRTWLRAGDDLTESAQRCGDGTLKPAIAGIFPFEDIAEAHRILESGKQIGRVVTL